MLFTQTKIRHIVDNVQEKSETAKEYIRKRYEMGIPAKWKKRFIIYLPVLSVVVSIFTILLSYLLAVYSDKLDPNHFVPFISDVGDFKPHSSVFTFGLTISGVITLAVVILRYLQVKTFYARCHQLNLASIITGFIFAFGRIIVITFQLSSQKGVHYFGAGLYGVGVLTYCMLQAALSYRNKCRNLFHVRLTLGIIMAFTGVFFGVFILPPVRTINHKYNVSQISEWIFGACKMILMITFVFDFRERTPYIGLDYKYREGYENLDLGNSYEKVKIHNKATQI